MSTFHSKSIYTVGIVDDHVLFAQSLEGLINTFDAFTVAFVARNGNDLISKLDVDSKHPDVILLDINMPRGLINSPKRKRILLILKYLFITFYFIDAIFLSDFIYHFLTYTFSVGTIFLLLAVCLYFADLMYQDVILNVTSSPYFWVSFGVILYCLSALPFRIFYNLMENFYTDIWSNVTFVINIVQYFCFAYAFLITKGVRVK